MKMTNEAVRAAIDDCLSGVQALPSVRADVLNQVRGEVKVKKKFSVGIIFAVLLILLMAGAAVAAGLGLFGQIGEALGSDTRLSGLDAVSVPVGLTFTTEDGVTVTIEQAYYDGSRIFISYREEGPYDVMSLGEGRPEVDNWDGEWPGEVYGQSFASDSPNHSVMVEHLDGSAPRWAKTSYVNIHDGLQIGEEYLDIIGGDTWHTEDGALVGWKECIVPEELAAEEVTFLLGTFTTNTTCYQDETGLYLHRGKRSETVWHPFTVKRDNTPGQKLNGAAAGSDWSAEAELTASVIDVRGEIVLRCPQSWVEIERTWENPEGTDYIGDWHVYMDDRWVKTEGVEWVSSAVDGQLTFGVISKLDGALQEMKLVPVYSRSGEHVEEAIVLKIAE